jgi:hypothetical protein
VANLALLLSLIATVSACRSKIAESASTNAPQPIEKRLDARPLAFTFRLATGEASPGEKFEAVVELEVAPLWEIHALNAPPEETATLIELVLPEGMAAEGAWKAPPARQSMFPGRGMTYAGRITFVQSVSILPTATAATLNVGCRVRFQACNDRQCLRPEELMLSIPLVVRHD